MACYVQYEEERKALEKKYQVTAALAPNFSSTCEQLAALACDAPRPASLAVLRCCGCTQPGWR